MPMATPLPFKHKADLTEMTTHVMTPLMNPIFKSLNSFSLIWQHSCSIGGCMKYPILIITLLFGLSLTKDLGNRDCTGPDCRAPVTTEFRF